MWNYFLKFLFGLFSCWCIETQLSVCWGSVYVCVLIRYSATLLNLSISVMIYLFIFGSLGFSILGIISSANRDSFTFSSPVWMPFIPFSCQITLSRTSRTISNAISGKRHPCLITDLSRKASSLSSLNIRLSVGFS